MNKQACLIFIFQIFFIAEVKYSEALTYRSCFPNNGHVCNPLYLCLCCPKLYFEDGSNGGYTTNMGYFCNMEGASIDPRGNDPYPKGCCQECTSEGDGCTSEGSPCCPDQTPQPDASCPAGETSCKRMLTNNTYVDGNHVPKECTGTLPKCYGENNYCYGSLTPCCENMYCNPLDPESRYSPKWGVCTRVEGYTGELTPELTGPAVGYPQPEAPRAEKCWNYGMTAPPTTPAETTPAATTLAETTLAETTLAETTPALMTQTTVPKSSCATEGMNCERRCCCKGLDCPDNWWPLYITRWVLNWFGIWNRVCRDYSPFAWYNPFTWFDY